MLRDCHGVRQECVGNTEKRWQVVNVNPERLKHALTLAIGLQAPRPFPCSNAGRRSLAHDVGPMIYTYICRGIRRPDRAHPGWGTTGPSDNRILSAPWFRRLTKSESVGISHHSCWTGCALRCRRGSQERPKSLFFAASWDFSGLRGELRGPIVFADLRILRASCPKAFGL